MILKIKYSIDKETDNLAPKGIQKLLDNKKFMKGINKALEILGE